MTVLAKFYVAEITRTPHAADTVVMRPATRGHRNAQWAAATPSGEFRMVITNAAALPFFERLVNLARSAGAPPEVLITIEAAEPLAAGDGHKYEASPVEPGVYGHGVCIDCDYALDGEIIEYDRSTSPPKEIGRSPAHPNG